MFGNEQLNCYLNTYMVIGDDDSSGNTKINDFSVDSSSNVIIGGKGADVNVFD
jgi:hypothetical protein